MNRPTRIIEVDAETAASLEALAEKRGTSLAELLAEFAVSEAGSAESIDAQIAELDRRRAETSVETAVPHAEVVRWLETWGTASYRPWPGK